MTAGVLGPAAVWAAIAFALAAVLTGRRRLLGLAALAGAGATLVLVLALLIHDFSLAYVVRTTSIATPWPYRLSALWGGMDGSMLFYSSLTLGVARLGLSRPAAVRVGATVGLGLMLVTQLFANPFVVPDIPAVDGEGLLAILQHPAMIYHPPLLYLGLVVLIVPFAMAVTTPGDGGLSATTTRRWLYVSWTLLISGMAFGANWAYVELGWGGFWAWDPVENTALMPWLAITVYLHTTRIEESSGRLRRWNRFYAGLPFALSVMGVYLTRSGATGSIHSFAEDPVVGRVLLVAAVVALIVVLVTAMRSETGEPWSSFRFDRVGWLSLSAVTLSVILVFVTVGSAYPAFVSVFGDQPVIVDSRFFVMTVLPVAVVVSLGLALGLRGDWKLLLVVTGLTGTATALTVGWRVGVALLAAATGALVTVLVLIVRKRLKGRMVTVYFSHLGMAVILLAVAGSSLGAEFSGSMSPGDAVEVGGHTVTLTTIETGESDRYVYVRSEFDVSGTRLLPEIRAYEDQSTPVSEPVLRPGVVDDVIVATSLLFPDGETVAVSVFVRPLVTWVWIGALLVGLGGLAALFGRDGAAAGRRRSAREGPPRGETTTDSVAR